VGQNGHPFKLTKLRSMRVDAEAQGARWAAKNDQRITRVGRLLRKTRIDELPQIVNVLLGDMSFVGPRPERPEFVADLTRQIPYFGARHSVKPGITGWAQVRFPYGASVSDSRRKLEYDLYYIKELFDISGCAHPAAYDSRGSVRPRCPLTVIHAEPHGGLRQRAGLPAAATSCK